MHIPDKWQMDSIAKLHGFMKEFGFALIVSSDLEASHLPLLLCAEQGKKGVLYGHFSRSNSHWQSLVNSQVVVVFSGPHSYISPTWYAVKPAVPTWNYSAVHATGTFELTDNDTTSHMLEATINKYEPSLLDNGGFIPKEFKAKLSKGIVGFKITISKLQGKDKLGQHRSNEDQQGVARQLAMSSDYEAQKLYRYMKIHQLGLGKK